MAFADALTAFEDFLSPWRTRIMKGKLLSNFGNRSDSLLQKICGEFLDRTFGFSLLHMKGKKLSELSLYIRRAQKSLFLIQIEQLERNAVKTLKKLLVQHLRKLGSFPSDSPNEFVDKVVRELNTSITELTPQFMVTESRALLEAASNRLMELSGSFPESAEGKLEALRVSASTASAVQPDAQSSEGETILPSRKRQLRVKFGLGLVGMLRPPGFGNIQGYVAHSTGIFGVPIELLLGFMNDGDANEVRFLRSLMNMFFDLCNAAFFQVLEDDAEFPILRLQPKIHFDVDYLQ
jgi:hypothetical protein